MASFGEDLRRERMTRGIALEQITDVTKISRRYLIALEQEKFPLLPGGILSKGIVRGYAMVVGLDQTAWTERFVSAYTASGQMLDDDRGWMTFASNVGRDRLAQREAMQMRLRWAGAVLLLMAVLVGGFFSIRYYGVRSGWWSTLLPTYSAIASGSSGMPKSSPGRDSSQA